jgi:hypothetical protein
LVKPSAPTEHRPVVDRPNGLNGIRSAGFAP